MPGIEIDDSGRPRLTIFATADDIRRVEDFREGFGFYATLHDRAVRELREKIARADLTHHA